MSEEAPPPGEAAPAAPEPSGPVVPAKEIAVRFKAYKQRSLEAKEAGEMEEAKKYLAGAKGLKALFDRAKAGEELRASQVPRSLDPPKEETKEEAKEEAKEAAPPVPDAEGGDFIEPKELAVRFKAYKAGSDAAKNAGDIETARAHIAKAKILKGLFDRAKTGEKIKISEAPPPFGEEAGAPQGATNGEAADDFIEPKELAVRFKAYKAGSDAAKNAGDIETARAHIAKAKILKGLFDRAKTGEKIKISEAPPPFGEAEAATPAAAAPVPDAPAEGAADGAAEDFIDPKELAVRFKAYKAGSDAAKNTGDIETAKVHLGKARTLKGLFDRAKTGEKIKVSEAPPPFGEEEAPAATTAAAPPVPDGETDAPAEGATAGEAADDFIDPKELAVRFKAYKAGSDAAKQAGDLDTARAHLAQARTLKGLFDRAKTGEKIKVSEVPLPFGEEAAEKATPAAEEERPAAAGGEKTEDEPAGDSAAVSAKDIAQRFKDYKAAVDVAKTEGDTDRAKKYLTTAKELKGFYDRARTGETFTEADVPPPFGQAAAVESEDAKEDAKEEVKEAEGGVQEGGEEAGSRGADEGDAKAEAKEGEGEDAKEGEDAAEAAPTEAAKEEEEEDEEEGPPIAAIEPYVKTELDEFVESVLKDKSDENFGDIKLEPALHKEMIRKQIKVFDRLRDKWTDRFEEEKLDSLKGTETFEKTVDNSAVVIASLSVVDVQIQEAKMEEKRVAELRESNDELKARAKEIAEREVETKLWVEETFQKQVTDIEKREKNLGKFNKDAIRDQGKAFRRVEERIKRVLKDQKKTIKKQFGSLVSAAKVYGGPQHKSQNYDKANRLVRVRCDYLRAIKNKLPGGKYVMLVTLYDRLGGHPLRWVKTSGHRHTGHTAHPQMHYGKFGSTELSFRQSQNRVFIACPKKSRTHSSMVFLFELFRVRGGSVKHDHVVGWGALPLANASLEICKGKYKIPLLRGEMNPNLDKFSKIEKRMADNIDHWLCNFYFDIKFWPRIINGKNEYDTELEFANKFLTVSRGRGATKFDPDASESEDEEMNADSTAAKAPKKRTSVFQLSRDSVSGKAGKRPSIIASNNFLAIPSSKRNQAKKNGGMRQNTFVSGAGLMSKQRTQASSMNLMRTSTNDSMASDTSTYRSAAPAPTFVFKKSKAVGAKSTMSLLHDLDKTEGSEDPLVLEELEFKRKAREHEKELQNYKYSVVNTESDIPPNNTDVKMHFILSAIWADVNFSRFKTLECWATILLFAITWWLRMYVHYLGQYGVLQAMGSNVYQLVPKTYTVLLSYSLANMSILSEGLVVATGVISNQILFLLFMLIVWIVEKTSGTAPDMLSRFMLTYGMNVVLDPIWTLICDLAYENWQGDAFKMYQWYVLTELNGTAGAMLVFVVYFMLMVFSGWIYYAYLLNLHMDGRMLDVYNRLHGDEKDFFLPHDMEISVRTLRFILKRARKWRGLHGTRRKIALTKYEIQDHTDNDYRDVTMHLVIYNVNPKHGAHEEEHAVYRRFIRRNDGAILELFEGMGDSNYLKLEEQLLQRQASDQADELEGLIDEGLVDEENADDMDLDQLIASAKASRSAKSVKSTGADDL